ncbi:uncharacterized protein LOC129720641 [Wyeomyia smithii]|uniref:uncharacterized protein LOC129720641 n=1 Tax=Wyeomyia smithii TaxID=174621 RepID=UPI002467E757|nr:uncharacterized protein LOC129720641 [Wyeomyia smithii]
MLYLKIRVHERELIVAHCQSIFSVLETAKPTDEVMVFGDFNLPRISWREFRDGFLYPDLDHSSINPNAALLLDCYSSATLTQINHITNQNNRILDLCFVSAQDTAPYLCEAPAPLVKIVPHHPPLLVTINAELKRDLDTASATVSYDFRKADHQKIAEFFSELDWNSIFDSVDADVAAQTFSNVLAYAIDRYVPKKCQHPAPRQPWQRELRQLKSQKRAALRKFTKHRTLSLKRHYRKLKSRPKQFWRFVNQQRHKGGIPSSITFNGKEATTPQDICQLFSEKFASVFTDETLSDNHVERAASNTHGPLSVAFSDFPSCWKSAYMFPVHKKGNKNDVSNYRGITSLCAVAKLFELVIMEPLLAHCKAFISTDQHGFTAGRSTTTNLLCLTSYISDSMAKRAQTDGRANSVELRFAFTNANNRIVANANDITTFATIHLPAANKPKLLQTNTLDSSSSNGE